ncbi:hypothetical protein EZ428_05315 [Pedobacter frigiditerrae]|uniref:Uncharacterized protein n=1 Tax=Pedobacter frigiditerrae TaxID=2530452 RepID=A0A4R0N2Y2_9SPHI|nr:hypothetical protein [Pedobacter frigiditerrae]TCC94198.1 hypothetical protein EZ428_05315 [Pedobacter frigiditerrae]
MKKLTIITCAFLLPGCGTLNKDKLFSKNIKKETLSQEHSETLAVQQAVNIRDSTYTMMELTIWPKGPFTFSPATGFAGEAFKMEMRGKQSSLVDFSKVTSANRGSNTRLKQEKVSVTKQKEKKVEWEGMSYGGCLLVVVVVVFSFLFFRRRLSFK